MDYFMGEILLLPYSGRSMRGLMRCEGQVLSIYQYQALFSILGAKYGGDGVSTFALPNLKNNAPLEHMNYYIVVEGLYPVFE